MFDTLNCIYLCRSLYNRTSIPLRGDNYKEVKKIYFALYNDPKKISKIKESRKCREYLNGSMMNVIPATVLPPMEDEVDYQNRKSRTYDHLNKLVCR